MDVKAEMLKVYNSGMEEISKLQEQINKRKEELKGAKAYLEAVGELTKEPSKRGRKKKEPETTE
jgi:nitrogen fixation/metabolism regulation signal transduction histidine kinase